MLKEKAGAPEVHSFKVFSIQELLNRRSSSLGRILGMGVLTTVELGINIDNFFPDSILKEKKDKTQVLCLHFYSIVI